MLSTLVEKIPPSLRTRAGLAGFLLGGVAASFLAANAAYQTEIQAREQEFERRQSLRHAFVEQGLRAYENSLFALELVAANNISFTPAEFDHVARRLYERNPGIQSIQWVAQVTAPEVPDFLARVRREVRPDFTIRERAPDGTRSPVNLSQVPPDREFAVISYVYPIDGNDGTFGYDVRTAPSAAQVTETRGTHRMVLTPPFPLVQGFLGVVLTVHTNRPPSPHGGPPQVGPGYAQIVLGLEKTLHHIWTQNPGATADFALFDVTGGQKIPLYTQLQGHEASDSPASSYDRFITPDSCIRDLPIAGRVWRAVYRPPANWKQASVHSGITLIFFGGCLLTVLGAAYLRLLLLRTERIHSEVLARTAELTESRALLNEIIDHNPSAIWVKDTALRYQLANRVFAKDYGFEPSRFLGHTDEGLHPPENVTEMQQRDLEVLARGVAIHFEGTYTINGQVRTYLIAKFPIRHTDGCIYAVAGVATEITQLRAAEADRLIMERKLQETQKLESLGVLAGGIAHDFNNLLTGILGHASLCRYLLEPGSSAAASLQQIETAARRAAELCQQMLAYSGRGRFSIGPLDFGALVEETVPLLRLSVSKDARLAFKITAGLPAVVADATQLRQVVMNLVMNAAEALPPGGGDITIHTCLVQADAALFSRCVHPPGPPPGPYVCLEVTDNGTGMTPDIVAKIFDPFFTTKFTGRGLGLAALLGIVRSHHGALRVVSQPGQGTSFFVYLPAGKNPVAPAPAKAAPPVPAPSTVAAGRCILLVDDETAVRETAALILKNIGYQADPAADGQAALALFRKAPARYSAALVDLTMPGLSGGELVAALRTIRPGFPVLLMSGYSDSDAAAILAAPATDFLSKPFTIPALREKLSQLLTAK